MTTTATESTAVRLTTEWPFDQPHHVTFCRARAVAIQAFLRGLSAHRPIATGLDMGCALGYFTRVLSEAGLAATGMDGRAVNIEEARRRHPGLPFAVQDVQDQAILAHGSFDVVLCLGLLYHFEHPLLALQHLARLTRVCLYLEGEVMPGRRPHAIFCEEGRTESQGLQFVAFYPSEACVIKMLYRAGFAHVYRPPWPDSPNYRSSLWHRRRRTVLVASHEPLPVPSLNPVAEPRSIKPYTSDRFPLVQRVGRAVLRRLRGAR